MCRKWAAFIQHALVFNAGQIDGLPAAEQRASPPEWERHKIAEAILANAGVPIEHRPGDLAAYSPGRTASPYRSEASSRRPIATMPLPFMKKGHATGHPSRLSRDLSHPFGSTGYAREELRAEIASVARQLREAHPATEIYVAGDNDHKEQETDAQGRPKPNAGGSLRRRLRPPLTALL